MLFITFVIIVIVILTIDIDIDDDDDVIDYWWNGIDNIVIPLLMILFR